MQVGTGGVTGGAYIADDLTALYIVTDADSIMGHVAIEGGKTVQMVDDNIITIGIVICSGGHGATLGGVDGGTLSGGKVYAVVEGVVAGDGVDAVAVGTGEHGAILHGEIEAFAGSGRCIVIVVLLVAIFPGFCTWLPNLLLGPM